LANVVGLDFVGDRLHVAQVDGASGSATVRGSFTAPLPQPLAPSNAAELGRWLKEQLALNRIGGAEAAVSLGRGHSSFRTLQVPDCPPEELPGLVQLTLEGDNGIEGHTVVDFDAGPVEGGQRTVTAAYASVQTVDAVRETLKAAGLNVRRLVLRPYAMRFLREQMLGPGDAGTELLLIPTGDGLDLSIWSGQRLEMSRSVSVNGHGDASAKLTSELRRTLAAYQNNKPGASLTSVAALAGEADSYGPSVERALQRSVSSADPSKKLRNLPESKQAWGAVATAWQAAAAALPTLNLLDPRKPPPPKYSTRRIATLAGAAFLVLVGTVYFWRDSKIRSLEDQITALELDKKDLDTAIKAESPNQKKSAEVKKWVQSHIDWLDRLNDLANVTPPTDKGFLTKLRAEARESDGLLKVDVRAQDADTFRKSMDAMGRENRFEVFSKKSQPNADHTDFKLTQSFDVIFSPKGAKAANGKAGTLKKTNGKTVAAVTKSPPVDVIPEGKVRVATGFGMKRTPTNVASTPRPGSTPSASGGASRTVTTAPAAGESTGVDSLEAKITKLAALPLDEFERELAKEPSLLRNRLKKRVEEFREKSKAK
jgi:hypothetical protein